MNFRISWATKTWSRFRPVTSRTTPPSCSFRMFAEAAAGVIFSALDVAIIVVDGILHSRRHRADPLRYALALVLAVSGSTSAYLLISDVITVRPIVVDRPPPRRLVRLGEVRAELG